MAKDQDMTTGNPFKLILSFSSSMIFGNIFQQLYTVVDNIIIGKKIGALGIASIGGTDWLIFLVTASLIGLIQGFSVLLGNKYGEKNEQAFYYYYKKAQTICIIISILLIPILLICLRPFLNLIGTLPEAFDYAYTYAAVIFAGIPFLIFYQFFAATLRSRGNSHIPLLAMTISSLCNIVLDLLFICIMHLGVAGAALGTILSECLVMIICGYHVLKIKSIKEKIGKNSYKEKHIFHKLISTGLPMAIQSIITAIGGLIVTRNVNMFGIDFLSGYTIGGKIYALLEIAASSYGMAIVAYVSQNHGAKKIDRIHSGVKSALLLGIVTALICSFIMIFFGESSMKLFVEADKTSPMAFSYGRQYLLIIGLFYPLLYTLYIIRAALQGIGNTLVPMISSAGQLLMRVLYATVMTKIIGYTGIFYGEVSAWILADLILFVVYFYEIRNKEKAI